MDEQTDFRPAEVPAEPRTPRQRARVQTLRRIHDIAWGQLSSHSAGELSLRAIARELGIVSSAIYRYYASRDDLITALIIEAYGDLAEALEEVGQSSRLGPRRRWLEVATGFRAWATSKPHRFALLYGTPIPGYRAPQDTIEPAGRVLRAFGDPVAAAVQPPEPGPISRRLRTEIAAASVVFPEADEPAVLALTAAFARLIGVLTLELNGQFVGSFEPADALYEALAQREADALGL